MLYRVGTMKEIEYIRAKFPAEVMARLRHCTGVLDEAYGADRNYLQSGGYTFIAESEWDLAEVRKIIDFDTHPCEWADPLDGGFLSALYLLNDDFSVVVIMPIDIAPPVLQAELED